MHYSFILLVHICAGLIGILSGGTSVVCAQRFTVTSLRKTHLPEVPVLTLFVVMLFWLWRVLLTKAYTKPRLQGANAATRAWL